jgi:hypothetical protein
MHRSPFLFTCGIAALMAACLGPPASADPINYDATKGFSITDNSGLVPTLTGFRFLHAINRERTVAENTGGQLPLFNPFNNDDAFYKQATSGPGRVLAIQNGVGPQQLVPIQPQGMPLGLGVTSRTVTAGDATATTTFNVTTLAAGRAAGTVRVNGSAPEDAMRRKGFAFSYGDVRATITGRGMVGGMVVNPGTVTLKRGVSGIQRVLDPLNFVVTNDSGAVLLAQTLGLFAADVENGGGLTWDNNLLTFDSAASGENARFELDATPLSGSASSLLLEVQNGQVVKADKTGPLFNSLFLPSLGSSGAFALTVPGSLSFNYDLSRFGSEEVNATADWAVAGEVGGGAVPEPSSLLLLGIGSLSALLFAARLRRIRPALT